MSKYTKLLTYWKKQGISLGIREQLLDLLTCPDLLQLDPSCKDLLSSITFIRTRMLHVIEAEHIDAFYHRLGYDLGHEQVRERCRACLGSMGDIYNTSWQRRKTGTIPTYVEIRNIVDALYANRSKAGKALRHLRHEQGEGLWMEAKRHQYKERGIEAPLAEVLIAIEKDLATRFRETVTHRALQERYGLGPLHAARLIQSELIEGDAIDPVLGHVVDPSSRRTLRKTWGEAYALEKVRPSFGKLCAAAMEERGFTAADLAKILGVAPPEERGKQKKERKQRFRPDSDVRGVLFSHHTSSQIAVEAIIHVLSHDEDEARLLREAYVAERERFYRRKGDWIHGQGLTMRIWRELANVDMNTLAQHFLPEKKHNDRKAVRQKNQELQRLERQEGKRHTISFKDVQRVLQDIAQERAEEALARLQSFDAADESLKNFSTVREMAKNLIRYCKGGAKEISQIMRDMARNDSEWLRSDLITAMGEGTFVSALPPLRVMAQGTIDAVLPEDVLRDWHERFPLQLQKGVVDFGKVHRPLARVLSTLIARLEANPIRFFADRVPGIVPTLGTKYLRQLDVGESVEWRHLHKCLLGMGVRSQHPLYQFVQTLHANNGDVAATLEVMTPIHRAEGLEIHPMNFPGLTAEELAPFLKKK
jgi:hypothetical protein